MQVEIILFWEILDFNFNEELNYLYAVHIVHAKN
jgi:hypothetical protein